MSTGQSDAQRLLAETLAGLDGGADSESLISAIKASQDIERLAERARVEAVAELWRRGVFAEFGYKQPVSATANLLGIERDAATRIIVAAENVCARSTLQGEVLAPKLPAMAAAFAAGTVSIRHVAVAATVLALRTAERLAPQVWAQAETRIAESAVECTPRRLHTIAIEYLELLDQDGVEPDDRPPTKVNELRATRLPGYLAGGGRITGTLEPKAALPA